MSLTRLGYVIGYVIIAAGVVLFTISALRVVGWTGFLMATVNLICVAVALVCIHSLRRRRR